MSSLLLKLLPLCCCTVCHVPWEFSTQHIGFILMRATSRAFLWNTDPLTYSAFCQWELHGRIQFTVLHSLLRAKNVAWLSLINMDLAHTNRYQKVLGSCSFPLNVKSTVCVYFSRVLACKQNVLKLLIWAITKSQITFTRLVTVFPRLGGGVLRFFFTLHIKVKRPCQKHWITDRHNAQNNFTW